MTQTRWTGPDLAETRREARLRREDVAERLGVSVSRVRNAEIAASVPDTLASRILSAVLELAAERRR